MYSVFLILVSFVIETRFLTLLYHFSIVLGLVFGIISFIKKEDTDYKTYIGFIGNIILFIIFALLNIFVFKSIYYA